MTMAARVVATAARPPTATRRAQPPKAVSFRTLVPPRRCLFETLVPPRWCLFETLVLPRVPLTEILATGAARAVWFSVLFLFASVSWVFHHT